MNTLWNNIFRSKLDEETLGGFLAKVPVFTELEKRDLGYLFQVDVEANSWGDLPIVQFIR